MQTYNKAFLIGRVASDIKIERKGDGGATARFVLETVNEWSDKNGEIKERRHKHSVRTHGKRAELCVARLKMGSRVHVEGEISTFFIETVNRVTYEIIAKEIVFLDEPHASNEAQKTEVGAP